MNIITDREREEIERYLEVVDAIQEPSAIIASLDYLEMMLEEEEGLLYVVDEIAYNILIDRLLDQYEQIRDYFGENYPTA